MFDLCKTTDFTNKGKCSNCGECCSDILPLTDADISRIKEHLKTKKIEQNNKGANVILCPFRNNIARQCMIYSVRPVICRIFKCDKTLEQSVKELGLEAFKYSKAKKCSMAQVFFNDNTKVNLLKELGLDV